MSGAPLVDLMQRRVDSDKEDGDIAYFISLGLQFEFITKISIGGLVALICEDPDRHRYTIEHRLVRANGIGEWAEVAANVVTGPALQFFRPECKDILRDFTERSGPGDWKYRAGAALQGAATSLGVEMEQVSGKYTLRQLFAAFATIRNKSKGHRAPTAAQCRAACGAMVDAIGEVQRNLQILQIPWVYLHRCLSGKYRVSNLANSGTHFDYLKRRTDARLADGVHIYVGGPIHVPLVISDVEVRDVLVPNGQLARDTFELLSYATNDTRRADAGPWMTPPDRLPASETEGPRSLDQYGHLFANLPPRPLGYISRAALEQDIVDSLVDFERHPIISLTGPGGIGKTTLALAALEMIASQERPPYEVVIWTSARDIDLLQDGPKPVSPRVVTKREIAQATVELLGPAAAADKDFSSIEYFQGCLTRGAAGPTLFVVDNFETVENPLEVYNWLDAHIRIPNKVNRPGIAGDSIL